MTPVQTKAFHYSLVPHFEGDDYSIIEEFHEYSKLTRANVHDLMRRVGLIIHSLQLRSMMTKGWKTYRGHARTPLPPPTLGSMTLEDALRRRRSLTAFRGPFLSGGRMTLDQLSGVLGLSYGVTSTFRIPGTETDQTFRAATSAGGLYPLEIYPLVLRVDGLEEGVYHYRVVDHSLELVRGGPCRSDFLKTTNYHDLCANASVILAVTAVFRRNLCKYLHRGYRFLMNDAGALIQNFYLTATGLNLGACALGGFMDDEVGNLLGVDNVEEAVVLCFVLGVLE